MKPVLVLGGHGFIGMALVKRLQQQGTRVHVLGHGEAAALEQWLPECGTVVHLASSTTPGSSAQKPLLEQANVRFTQHLVEILQNLPGTHLVYFSSGGTVYGDPVSLPVQEHAPLAPLSPHGVAKVAQENTCLTLRTRDHAVSILRPSNIYGPTQTLKGGFGLVRTLLEHARLGTTLQVWGNGGNVRDYLFIDDLVEATLRLIAQPDVADTYNLGSGVGHSVNQVKALVEEVTGRTIAVCYNPARGVDVRAVVLDGQRLQDAVRWRPGTELLEGIRQTWNRLELGV